MVYYAPGIQNYQQQIIDTLVQIVTQSAQNPTSDTSKLELQICSSNNWDNDHFKTMIDFVIRAVSMKIALNETNASTINNDIIRISKIVYDGQKAMDFIQATGNQILDNNLKLAIESAISTFTTFINQVNYFGDNVSKQQIQNNGVGMNRNIYSPGISQLGQIGGANIGIGSIGNLNNNAGFNSVDLTNNNFVSGYPIRQSRNTDNRYVSKSSVKRADRYAPTNTIDTLEVNTENQSDNSNEKVISNNKYDLNIPLINEEQEVIDVNYETITDENVNDKKITVKIRDNIISADFEIIESDDRIPTSRDLSHIESCIGHYLDNTDTLTNTYHTKSFTESRRIIDMDFSISKKPKKYISKKLISVISDNSTKILANEDGQYDINTIGYDMYDTLNNELYDLLKQFTPNYDDNPITNEDIRINDRRGYERVLCTIADWLQIHQPPKSASERKFIEMLNKNITDKVNSILRNYLNLPISIDNWMTDMFKPNQRDDLVYEYIKKKYEDKIYRYEVLLVSLVKNIICSLCFTRNEYIQYLKKETNLLQTKDDSTIYTGISLMVEEKIIIMLPITSSKLYHICTNMDNKDNVKFAIRLNELTEVQDIIDGVYFYTIDECLVKWYS